MHAEAGSTRIADGAPAVTVTGVRQKEAWAARTLPPVERLPGDIWSVPVPIPGNPLRYTLSYVLPGTAGLIVVDPGWDSAEGWGALCRGLAAAGAAPADVTGVVVTHVHPDHHGLTGRLKAASGAWVAMHPAEHDSLPHRRPRRGTTAVDEGRAWMLAAGAPEHDVRQLLGPAGTGSRRDALSRLIAPDLLLEDQDRVPVSGRNLVALWTPGHTPGHLCLAESAAGVVLTGDHVLPRITPNIGLHGRRQGQTPLVDFLHSLERLAGWDGHEALPAHEYRFRGLAARTAELRDHHSRRLDELLSVVDALGRPTLWEVTAGLSWSRPWDEVGAMRTAALAETEAHAQYLVDRGVLARSGGHASPVRLSRAPSA
ncbi:Zn-dependent hydrolase [Streptomyces sp. MNU77]|uniref:MBL fold metallo-hydrolase n=1 Tax=Streptomyces sp. MNU77 TaxID=1573406 RepID=UPI00063FDBB2|nr:MBL fold metallo-hydrolase [Streptomyces sp. MNU77]OLO25849.1 Zn-dependent hydrolase [Streptomyces sp. MNU77]